MIREFALEQVGTGWMLYSSRRRLVDDNPVGGICVEVITGNRDDDTGEITPARYRCVDPHQHCATVILVADEVDIDQLAGIDRRACATVAVRMLAPIYDRRTRRLTGADDVERIHDAWQLAATWSHGR